VVTEVKLIFVYSLVQKLVFHRRKIH